jgi:hypothetical protein
MERHPPHRLQFVSGDSPKNTLPHFHRNHDPTHNVTTPTAPITVWNPALPGKSARLCALFF